MDPQTSNRMIDFVIPLVIGVGFLLHFLAAHIWLPRRYNGGIIWGRLLYSVVGLAALTSMPLYFLDPRVSGHLLAVTVSFLALVVIVAVAIRISLHGLQRVDEAFVDVSLVHFVGAVVWLDSILLQRPLMHVQWPLSGFTVVHFLFAAHLFPMLLAAATRLIPLDCSRSRAAVGIAFILYYVGFWGVALSIGNGNFSGQTSIVYLGAGALLCLIVLALNSRSWVRGAVFAATLLSFTGWQALSFSSGQITSLEIMLLYHGLPNALLLVPILLFFVEALPPQLAAQDIPLSRAISRGAVRSWIENFKMSGGTESGFVPDLSVFDSPELVVAQVPQEVRRFYERTAEYSIDVAAQWHEPFGRIWAKLQSAFARWEQFALTLGSEQLVSEIARIHLPGDPRPEVRAWLRWEPQSKRTMYVATYATHKDSERVYMNIAFPLPFGTVSSILRLCLKDATLDLTSLPHVDNAGDEGVYFCFRRVRFKMPLNETIRVSLGERAGEVIAEHRMWLFGVRFVTLNYRMRSAECST